MISKQRAYQLWMKYWFLVGLVLAILVAGLYPPLGKKGGILRSEYTVSYGVVILIFFLSGLSLKSKALLQATLDWKLHLVVQIISLGVTPTIGYAISRLLILSPSFDFNLALGLIICCSTPTTISSNVLMTKQANGNEAAALVNAVIGNVIGVFISPSLILGFIGSISSDAKYTGFDYSVVFIKLILTVVIPLIVGQLVRFIFPNFTDKLAKKVPLPIVNSTLLLILVWAVMSETFSSQIFGSISVTSLVAIVFIDLGFYILFSLLSLVISLVPIFKFTRKDSAAIVMCGATKTVALGVPMINIIFGHLDIVGILTIPLLIYHAEQLVAGQLSVAWFRRWIGRQQTEVGAEVEDGPSSDINDQQHDGEEDVAVDAKPNND